MHTATLQQGANERRLVVAAAIAIGAAIAWAAWARANVEPAEPAPRAIAERLLRFEDLANGHLRVTDARTGAVVQDIEGEAGFARGTLRSFMRERKRQGAGPGLPLALRVQGNGRLHLSDPATGRDIDLEAFGPDNAAVFARLLASSGETK